MATLTYQLKDGAVYAVRESERELDDPNRFTFGSWGKPFPNIESGSFAFDIIEAWAQTAVGTLLIKTHGAVIVLIRLPSTPEEAHHHGPKIRTP